MPRTGLVIMLIVFALLVVPFELQAQDPPVVHTVMFYSSSCTHCQQVLQETLPPLRNTFDRQLDLLLLDSGNRQMSALYDEACVRYMVPDDLCGAVPAVMIGPDILIGEDQIKARLPELVAQGVQAGGIAFPELPGMQAAIAYIDSFRTSSVARDDTAHGPEPDQEAWYAIFRSHPFEAALMTGVLLLLVGSPLLWWQVLGLRLPLASRRRRLVWGLMLLLACSLLLSLSLFDPGTLFAAGNWVMAPAIVILLGLIGGIWWTNSGDSDRLPYVLELVVFWLVVVGLLIAGYMLRSETGEQLPYCGPIGDCVTVQHSEYARLFGWLPVGALGVVGYASILLVWSVTRFGPQRIKHIAIRIQYLLLLFGVLFSLYLTFLELFVIRAMCVWCLTSALTMLLIFWAYCGGRRLLYGGEVTHY